MALIKIISYQLNQYSGTFAKTNRAALIIMTLENGEKANLYFLDESKALSTNSFSSTVYRVYYYISRFIEIAETLRNEKPCYFYFNHSNKISYIATGTEEVGEEET